MVQIAHELISSCSDEVNDEFRKMYHNIMSTAAGKAGAQKRFYEINAGRDFF